MLKIVNIFLIVLIFVALTHGHIETCPLWWPVPLDLIRNEAGEIKQYAILLRDTQTQPWIQFRLLIYTEVNNAYWLVCRSLLLSRVTHCVQRTKVNPESKDRLAIEKNIQNKVLKILLYHNYRPSVFYTAVTNIQAIVITCDEFLCAFVIALHWPTPGRRHSLLHLFRSVCHSKIPAVLGTRENRLGPSLGSMLGTQKLPCEILVALLVCCVSYRMF